MSDYKNQIEAILFSSGRLMELATIMNLTGISNKQVVKENIERLRKEYEARDSPMMIVQEKEGWKLTVREKYLPIVRKIVSDMELPRTILETLAVIAWKAPIRQSEVVRVRHNKAYEHIEELINLGFITKEKKGRSFILKLADKFYSYFDIDGKNIKEFLKQAKLPEKKPEEAPASVQPAAGPAQEKPAELPKTIVIYDEDTPGTGKGKAAREAEEGEHLGPLEIYDEPGSGKEGMRPAKQKDKRILGAAELKKEMEEAFKTDLSGNEPGPGGEEEEKEEPAKEPSDKEDETLLDDDTPGTITDDEGPKDEETDPGLEEHPHDESAEDELYGAKEKKEGKPGKDSK